MGLAGLVGMLAAPAPATRATSDDRAQAFLHVNFLLVVAAYVAHSLPPLPLPAFLYRHSTLSACSFCANRLVVRLTFLMSDRF